MPLRAAAVLVVLVRRPGEVVSKADLIAAAWPELHVTESSVSEAISQVRQALGDDAQSPRWIQTVPRRGYRFCGRLDAEAEGPVGEEVTAGEPPRQGGRARVLARVGWPLAGALGLIALAGVRQPVPEIPVRERFEFSIPLPAESAIEVLDPSLAMAPDGSEITVALFRDGVSSLWRRRRDQVGLRLVPATAGARSPSYHPDGRLFFLRQDWVEVIDSGGTVSRRVIAAPEATDLAVASGGTLLLTHVWGGRLSRSWPPFDAWSPLAEIDREAGETGLLQPVQPGPGRIRFIRWRGSAERSVWVELDEATGEQRTLGPALANAMAIGEHWLWTQGDQIQSGREAGSAEHTVATGAFVDRRNARGQVAASHDELAYLAAPGQSGLQLVVADSQLRRDLRLLAEGHFVGFRSNAGGDTVAMVLDDDGSRDLWTLDVETGTEQRHTYGAMITGVAFEGDSEVLFTLEDGRFERLDLRTGRVESLFQVPGGRPGTAIAGGYLFSAPDPSGRLRLGLARRLPEPGQWTLKRDLPTSCDGHQQRPTRSPGGRHLAFLCLKGAQGQLFVASLDASARLDLSSAVQVTREDSGFLHFDWFGRDSLWLATQDGHVVMATLEVDPSPRLRVDQRFHSGPWVVTLPRRDGTFLAARLGEREGQPPAIRWLHGWRSPAAATASSVR